jgi:hypothetical protein
MPEEGDAMKKMPFVLTIAAILVFLLSGASAAGR